MNRRRRPRKRCLRRLLSLESRVLSRNGNLPCKLPLVFSSALLTWFSFPNFLEKDLDPSTAFLSWFALAPFLSALEGASCRRGAAFGFLFGTVSLGGVLYWIALLEEAGPMRVLAWAALSLLLGTWFLLFGAGYAVLRRRGVSALLAAPALWTLVESFRGSVPFGGFPWGQIGYAHAADPWGPRFAPLAGVSGLTFLTVAVNAAWVRLWGDWRKRPQGVHPLQILAFRGRRNPALLVLLAAALIPALPPPGDAGAAPAGKAALIQPSVDQSRKWDRAFERETYDLLEQLTLRAAEGDPDFVVWPETAVPSYLLRDPRALSRVSDIVRRAGTPLLAGCLDVEGRPEGQVHYNAAVPFDARGVPGEPYRKRHLVPFGEYVPWRGVFDAVSPVVAALGEFEPGARAPLLRAGSLVYAPFICYEVIFLREVRTAAKGAGVLVNVSNDAWYGDTAAPWQHALHAVVRSAELGLPLLRCANNGISLATDAAGRVTASTGLNERAVLVVPVAPPAGGTPFAALGDWVPAASFALLVLGALFPSRWREP